MSVISKKIKRTKQKFRVENTTYEMKNAIESVNSRMDQAEERIWETEDRNSEIIQLEENKEKRVKESEGKLYDPSDTSKEPICELLEFQKEKRGRVGAESLFKEIMAENSPNIGKDLDSQVHEPYKSPNKINLNRSSPRHIITKLLKIKDKERILKEAREKKLVTYKGTTIRLLADFSAETL